MKLTLNTSSIIEKFIEKTHSKAIIFEKEKILLHECKSVKSNLEKINAKKQCRPLEVISTHFFVYLHERATS